jgi:hexosaminidase
MTLNYTSNSDRPPLTEEIINSAIQRTWNTILSEGYVPWRFHPRNAQFEPTKGTGKSIASIKLQLSAPDSPNIFRAADGEIDESYTLKVTEDGEVTVAANSSIGLVRGLTTFTQLFYAHSTEKDQAYTSLAPVDIEDTPFFVHRGLNMDLSRSYFGVDDIRRQIDALAYNKMNRLHLHITDAQSWPLEIPAMPELSEKGAYNSKLTYTPDDVAYLQRYGAMQGVQVLLEIDMPGHTSSLWYSHPELIASFNQQPDWDKYAAEPPSGTLKLNEPKVYDFVKKLLDDLLPRIKPYTNYFHTGGDEVKAFAYNGDDTIKSGDMEVIRPYLQKFVDHAHKIVRDAGLTPMVWEEMVLDWGLDIGKDVIVQTWQESNNVNATVSKGFKTLVGNYYFWVRNFVSIAINLTNFTPVP